MIDSSRVVCDASALVEFVVGAQAGYRIGSYLEDAELHLPHLAFVEVAHVLRMGQLAKALTSDRATEALGDVLALEAEVWAFHEVADRVWELRRNVTPYDAFYVALAELLDATFITLDESLSRATGIRCEVIVA